MFLPPSSVGRYPEEAVYPGSPLSQDEIRLVTLRPGAWNDPIICELTTVHLDFALYQTLSYVWGSPHVTRPILLNGQIHPVTVNLEGALRHLREKFEHGLIIWIDALCINQTDDTERAEQVRQMGNIYKQGSRVLVYLGDTLHGTANVTEPPPVLHFDEDVLPDISAWDWGQASPIEDVYTVFRFFHELSVGAHLDQVDVFKSFLHADVNRVLRKQLGLFEALRRFMQPRYTPWWSRIWVIQEVANAPDALVVYGTISAPWSMFARAMSNCATKFSVNYPEINSEDENIINDCYTKVLGLNNLRENQRELRDQQQPNDVHLLDLVGMFRNQEASDPRDKVYALLSLMYTPPNREPLLPDYSLTEAEVFRRATLNIIYSEKDFSIFSTELECKGRTDLPSWVPDWGATGKDIYSARVRLKEYNACPGTEATPATVRPIGNTALAVGGLKIDRVAYIGELVSEDIAENIQDTLGKWYAYMRREAILTQETSVIQNFWRIICADSTYRMEEDNDGRRMRPTDELAFVVWSTKSKYSPFRSTLGPSWQPDPIWSVPASAWRDMYLLWPHLSVAGVDFSGVNQPDEVFRPTGLLQFPDERIRKIKDLLKFATKSTVIYEDLFDEFDNMQHNTRWKDLMLAAREELVQVYGESDDLYNYNRADPVLAIDASIFDATVSRRLIVSQTHGYVGLGPTNTVVGDELLFLVGGKTPLVLRPSAHGAEEVPGPRYEVVGDCYLQGLMDGGAEILRSKGEEWATLSLV